MELNWQNMKKIMVIVAFGILLYISLQNFDVIVSGFQSFMKMLSPFILGACIAFVVNIPMKLIENKVLTRRKEKKKTYNLEKREDGSVMRKKSSTNTDTVKGFSKPKRFVSIFVALFAIIFVLVLLFVLVVPELVNVIGNFIQYLSGLPAKFIPIVDEIAMKYPELGNELSELQIDFSNILNTAIEFLKNAGSGIVEFLGAAVSSTVSSIANLTVGIIFCFYLLMSKEKIGKSFKRMALAYLPEKYAFKVLEITKLSKESFTNFITGQLVEAVILGTLCYVGMLLLRLPYSLTISLLTTVTALIPIFGALIGASVGVILLLSVSPLKAITFLIFIIVLQQIETNLIYPKVVGDSVGLPGIIVLVAITVGGSVWGVLGMIVALPIVSVIYTLIKASVKKRLREKRIENI